MKLRFADCVLDGDARSICRGTAAIHLPPKAFELLTVLIEHRGRALSKAELLERVWPDVFVSDASLARAVREIREALGDSARGAHIIRTVHRYGYAFAASVMGDDPHRAVGGGGHPTCWLTTRTRTFGLMDGEHIVGREPDVTVWLDSPRVSRHHARILVNDAGATIGDLESKNGTFVRGVRLAAPTVLEAGDEIRIGPFRLIFRVLPARAVTETEPERSRHRRVHV